MTDDDTTISEAHDVTPTHYALPVDVLDAVMQNLAAQPYGQVADLIAAVQQHAAPVAP